MSEFSQPKTILPPELYDRWEREMAENEADLRRFESHFLRAEPRLQQETLDAVNEFWRNK